MIPNQMVDLSQLSIEPLPSNTYKLDLLKKRIGGKIDNEDAIMQMVIKLINTERYAFVIYSSQYGVELERLYGADYNFIESDIGRTIKDALLVDDRVLDVTDFEILKMDLDSMSVRFKVVSTIGETNIETEVNIS